MPFGLIDPDAPRDRPEDDEAAAVLVRERGHRAAPRDLAETASCYVPSPELVDAINVAIAAGMPLLLTGQPGTGKTQVAYYLKWFLRVPDDHFHVQTIRSGSSADELTYTVDEVRYFHAAQHRKDAVARGHFVDEGPLWKAYRAERQSIVLIDEIDKASRDFPNDLLFVLDQHRFRVADEDRARPDGSTRPPWVELAEGTPPPLIIITSNSERRLPDPFLRRCIFHHIEFSTALLRQAVAAHRKRWKNLSDGLVEVGIDKRLEFESHRVRRKPTIGELIVWFSILDVMAGAGKAISAGDLRDADLADLPAISALVKDGDDLGRL